MTHIRISIKPTNALIFEEPRAIKAFRWKPSPVTSIVWILANYTLVHLPQILMRAFDVRTLTFIRLPLKGCGHEEWTHLYRLPTLINSQSFKYATLRSITFWLSKSKCFPWRAYLTRTFLTVLFPLLSHKRFQISVLFPLTATQYPRCKKSWRAFASRKSHQSLTDESEAQNCYLNELKLDWSGTMAYF